MKFSPPPEKTIAEEAVTDQAEGQAESVSEMEINPIPFAVYSFAHDDIVLAPGDIYEFSLFEETEDAVTTPDCRTGSDATTYTYDGFTVSTVQLQNLETGIYKQPYISSIELSSANVSTEEGITVGSTKDDVLAVYGTDYVEEFGGWLYHSTGDTTLTIYFNDDGTASFIVYSLDSSVFDSAAVPEEEELPSYAYSEDPDSGIVFTGIETLYIPYTGSTDLSTIDFLDGVTATDRFGTELEMTYEIYTTTLVTRYSFGPGYAVITATDKLGNTNTARRPFFIEDYGEKDEEVLAIMLEKIDSSDPLVIKQWVVDHIWFSEDYHAPSPIRSGYYSGDGNCYVHARLLQEALRLNGYDTMMCWSTDSRHYWVLVYVEIDGVYCWRHLDATSLYDYQHPHDGYMTTEERYDQFKDHQLDEEFWPDAD